VPTAQVSFKSNETGKSKGSGNDPSIMSKHTGKFFAQTGLLSKTKATKANTSRRKSAYVTLKPTGSGEKEVLRITKQTSNTKFTAEQAIKNMKLKNDINRL